MGYGGPVSEGGAGGSGSGSGYRRVGEDRTANLKVNNITNRTGSNGTEVEGVIEAKGTHFVPPSGTTAERGSRGRGVFGGGYNPTFTNRIEYVTIATLGNSSDFGDLSGARKFIAGSSDSTRGLFMGGNNPSNNPQDTIDYVTISSTGNAFDFGNLTTTTAFTSAPNDKVRAVYGGGQTPTLTDVIQSVIVQSKGNAFEFGNLLKPRMASGSVSNSIRGLWGGGQDPSQVNSIEYITISTGGTAQDFGDLTRTHTYMAASSNTIRGLFHGGNPTTNTIDYVTIASTGDATDFGDLIEAARGMMNGQLTNSTRGVFVGGKNPGSPGYNDIISYVTIASTGNASDFGDTASIISYGGAVSDTNGGLG